MDQKRGTAACLTATWIAGAFLFAGCSVDVIPVHYSRVKSAQEASKPLPKGPGAPGTFKWQWAFTADRGFAFDPSQIEIADGVARLKPRSGQAARFATGKATLEPSGGFPYAALDSFAEEPGPENKGEFRYQLSPNASTWHFHDGSKWTVAGPTSAQANTAYDVNRKIADFAAVMGPGNLYVKIFFVSPGGNQPTSLKSLTVTGYAPKTDGWD